jgi:hypothetical protein
MIGGMSPTAAAHFVFVDFENVPDIDLGLIAGHPVKVTLLIGKNQKKLELPLVQQIHRLAGQVKLVEVGATGRNALDLTLTYYLGRTVHQSPAATYHIVSGDKDFDPLIAHLKAGGTLVVRSGSFAALPFLAPPKKTPSVAKPAPGDRPARLTARLKNPTSTNRPTTRRTLLSHIKSSLGPDLSEAQAEAFIQHLCTAKVLTLDARNKVHYIPTG